jgi:hypothetical protein
MGDDGEGPPRRHAGGNLGEGKSLVHRAALAKFAAGRNRA